MSESEFMPSKLKNAFYDWFIQYDQKHFVPPEMRNKVFDEFVWPMVEALQESCKEENHQSIRPWEALEDLSKKLGVSK